jgi:small subunit ribosomal protein S14
MAKKSMLEKQARRERKVARYAVKRKQLKGVIADPKATDDEKQAAQRGLQALPRDASPVRLRNRCAITGRAHGYYRKFGLGRNKLRETAMRGDIPGLTKASW